MPVEDDLNIFAAGVPKGIQAPFCEYQVSTKSQYIATARISWLYMLTCHFHMIRM